MQPCPRPALPREDMMWTGLGSTLTARQCPPQARLTSGTRGKGQGAAATAHRSQRQRQHQVGGQQGRRPRSVTPALGCAGRFASDSSCRPMRLPGGDPLQTHSRHTYGWLR